MLYAVLNGKGSISAVIGKGSNDYPVYSGDYEVVPKFEEQVLETADKVLKKDVKINSIPRYDVSNEAGGVTVYIATEEEENGDK